MKFKANTGLDKVFEVGVVIKGLDGLLEIAGGLGLLFIRPEMVNHWAIALTRSALDNDPDSYIANSILHTAQHLDHGALVFGALYLLSHGVVKVVLVEEILRNRLWAYPALILVTLVFMVYQIYGLIQSCSLPLLVFTLFDIVIIYLTAKEYRHRLELNKTA